MKKLLLILLACLMLTACGAEQSETEPTETTLPPIVGLYDPDSSVEAGTNGAVRAYPLESDNFTGIASMGDKLLLFEETNLTLLQGDSCQVAAELDTKQEMIAGSISVSVTDTGIAYYEKENDQVVLLNPQLQQSTVYALPADISGEPAIDLARQQVYYCDGQELRALNLQTGISRLIRSYTDGTMELTGIYFDGAVLSCVISNDESRQTLYLSTETGQTLSEDGNLYDLQTVGNEYFTMRLDGQVTQRIFGSLDTEAKSLNLDETAGYLVAALPLDGVVSCLAGEEGLQLSFYDLTSGLKTAAVTLEGITEPAAWHTDKQYIWLVACEDEHQVLYRWDIKKSEVQEDTVYTGTLYTYQNPNTAGLEALKSRVESMNQTYGVRISIWEDALKTPGEYTLKPEHQVSLLTQTLDELEAVLSYFPSKFLQVTVEAGWIRVCLVRSIDSGEEFVQYWAEGDCYAAISMGTDIKTAFLRCAAYGIDSHVMGNSRDFDTWNSLNPSGFSYGQEVDKKYLEGESRAFVDAESMINPHEDRSRIIASAMMEGNEELFASKTMQAKLLRVCEGIREAYGLEKSSETYIWEQYLNRSLAYTK